MPHIITACEDKVLEHFKDILNLIQDGVYISAKDGSTLLVNSSYERLTGISVSRVLGLNVRNLVTSGVFSAIVNPEVVATRKSVTLVQEVNGHKVVLQGNPIFDEDGEVKLVVTFVRDITLFERLKDEIANQKQLIDSYQRQVANFSAEDIFQEDGMVAVSDPSHQLLKEINTIAPTDAAVLVLGETGVGKDIVARKIHKKSQRAERQFIKVDCSVIPETLVESELFGYTAGAFSGAHTKGKEGFFEKANKGTLFLDEIGELPLSMQTKLLRAIQDQEIIRVGSTKVTPIDVRIIAATNRNLDQEVAKGTFRSDLYYRLKVAVLNILPLRERRDDILPLAKVFLQQYNKKYDKTLTLASGAENILFTHRWPGNVRELENLIHSLVVKTNKPAITCKDLPRGLASVEKCEFSDSLGKSNDIGKRPLKDIVRDFEQSLINEAVDSYGSVAKAAEVLQIDRTTLFRKMKGAEEKAKPRKQRNGR